MSVFYKINLTFEVNEVKFNESKYGKLERQSNVLIYDTNFSYKSLLIHIDS